MKPTDDYYRTLEYEILLLKRHVFRNEFPPKYKVGEYVWIEVTRPGDNVRTYAKVKIHSIELVDDNGHNMRYEYHIEYSAFFRISLHPDCFRTRWTIRNRFYEKEINPIIDDRGRTIVNINDEVKMVRIG